MMLLLRNSFFIAFFSLLLQLFLPWWVICLVGFTISYFWADKPWQAFSSGFLGIFVLWFIYAFYLDVQNNHLLSSKIIELFKLPNSISLVILTAFVGALACGFSSLTGRLLRNLA